MALEIFQDGETNHPLWFTIKDRDGEDSLASERKCLYSQKTTPRRK